MSTADTVNAFRTCVKGDVVFVLLVTSGSGASLKQSFRAEVMVVLRILCS
jgi:hypothetical protein